ncbi:MAG: NUDIX hydrolase, partial [Acidimicrobiales bacterium]
GLMDHRFHLFVADGAEHVGDPTDPGEAERIEWVPVPDVRARLRDGGVIDGLSFAALSYAFAFDWLRQ